MERDIQNYFITQTEVEKKILKIRGKEVILDCDVLIFSSL